MSTEIPTAVPVPRQSTHSVLSSLSPQVHNTHDRLLSHQVKRGRSLRRLTISTSPVVKLAPSPPSPFCLADILQPTKPNAPEGPAHVVLKFGGTSVAKCLSTIVDTITP